MVFGASHRMMSQLFGHLWFRKVFSRDQAQSSQVWSRSKKWFRLKASKILFTVLLDSGLLITFPKKLYFGFLQVTVLAHTAWKVSKYGVFSYFPYFPLLGLNTKIYAVNLWIQSEYRKIRTRENSVFAHLSRCANRQEMTVQTTEKPMKISIRKTVWICLNFF